MAISTCPKCESRQFEIQLTEPRGSAFKFYFIQCASCGAVVGVTDFYNTASLLETLAKKLGIKLHG